MADLHYPLSQLSEGNFYPRDAEEAQVLVRLVEFLQQHGDAAMEREIVGETGHITVSAHIENNVGNKVLLVFSSQEQRWKRPGGHIEDDAFQTARFEASRAVGGEIESSHPKIYAVGERLIPEYWNTPAHIHFEITFRFVIDETEELPRGARWYSTEEAAQLLQASPEVE